MTAKILLAEAKCTSHFSSPAFGLGGRLAEILDALHSAISPHFPVDLANMRVLAGATVSDVVAEVSMFGGNAIVSIGVKDMRVTFRQIKDADDIDICTRIVSLSHEALKVGLPQTNVQTVFLSCTVILDLDDAGGARHHLARSASADSRIVPEDLDGAVCSPVVNHELVNQESGWQTTFYAAPHRLDESKLYVGCTLEQDLPPTIHDPVELADRLQNYTATFLKAIDVEAEWPSEGH